MEFKAVKLNEAKKRSRGANNDLLELIEEFVQSKHEAVKVIVAKDEYATIYSCKAALVRAVTRSGHNLKVTINKGILYMYKDS